MTVSKLVISADINALKDYAHKASKKYNPADVFWLTAKEGEKSIQVKETAEFMQQVYLAPVKDSKLMVICDLATMTPQAQNKMLKTLEDAQGHTTFLLLATNIEPVLNTIQSRCMTEFLRTTDDDPKTLISQEIKRTLKDTFGVEIDEKTLSFEQKQAILDTVSKINRNVAANCNVGNQQDLLIMEILKYAKNSPN
ncbi:MAG: hypothetical protein LBG88_02485 [Christensenellaceae bacterium]|jgi:DNA polymerase III gamma/tau subunit|nr:hypothetical protein [Christensenellaceae bacterium]